MFYHLRRVALAIVLLSLTSLVSCVKITQESSITQVQTQSKEPLNLQKQGLQQFNQGKFKEALATFEQVLDIFRKNGQRQDEAATLKNIGQVYDKLGDYAKAMDYYQQALAITKDAGDKTQERKILTNMGLIHYKQGDYPKALESYQEALAISKETDDLPGEAEILDQIGSLLEAKKQPELAIIFYKQSVNMMQTVRQNIQALPQRDLKLPSKQQVNLSSYANKFANTHRRLGDLLLKKDRVLEAQGVLDLLKVQELDDYLHNVRGASNTIQPIEYKPPEKQLVDKFNTNVTDVVKMGKELSDLQKVPEAQRTPQQEARRQELEANQKSTLKDFVKFLDSPEVMAHLQELNRTTGGENLNPKLLRRLQNNLKELNFDAVLLYPLILEDRLELVLVTSYTPPIRRTVSVTRQELSSAIVEFRNTLMNPTKDAKQPGQKLYNLLIQPIESALKEANAKTIIYAPDGQLRYIPLSALYDGKQWLAQKYRVNNITALSLTDLDKRSESLKILAGAFSQGSYNVKVGTRTLKFGGLPFAEKEVENLTAAFPGSAKLLNGDFSKKETIKRMSDYSILHFATHAAFVTGKPDESFILFGDGEAANFSDVRLWNLNNTDLVVLSACETGLGGELGDGIEILGFGYVMEEAGAKAAVASLWQVSDDGTQALMNSFYAALQQDKLGKAEALQKAQLSLIDSNVYQHPYYWAGFILIGNGL
ncbi:MAG: CHAT domain-containing protein [Heteroscytonema crispum UTEX LB 1556]